MNLPLQHPQTYSVEPKQGLTAKIRNDFFIQIKFHLNSNLGTKSTQLWDEQVVFLSFLDVS